MAKEVEMPHGEKKIFLPSADSASFLLKSRVNWLIDFARESIGKPKKNKAGIENVLIILSAYFIFEKTICWLT